MEILPTQILSGEALINPAAAVDAFLLAENAAAVAQELNPIAANVGDPDGRGGFEDAFHAGYGDFQSAFVEGDVEGRNTRAREVLRERLTPVIASLTPDKWQALILKAGYAGRGRDKPVKKVKRQAVFVGRKYSFPAKEGRPVLEIHAPLKGVAEDIAECVDGMFRRFLSLSISAADGVERELSRRFIESGLLGAKLVQFVSRTLPFDDRHSVAVTRQYSEKDTLRFGVAYNIDIRRDPHFLQYAILKAVLEGSGALLLGETMRPGPDTTAFKDALYSRGRPSALKKLAANQAVLLRGDWRGEFELALKGINGIPPEAMGELSALMERFDVRVVLENRPIPKDRAINAGFEVLPSASPLPDGTLAKKPTLVMRFWPVSVVAGDLSTEMDFWMLFVRAFAIWAAKGCPETGRSIELLPDSARRYGRIGFVDIQPGSPVLVLDDRVQKKWVDELSAVLAWLNVARSGLFPYPSLFTNGPPLIADDALADMVKRFGLKLNEVTLVDQPRDRRDETIEYGRESNVVFKLDFRALKTRRPVDILEIALAARTAWEDLHRDTRATIHGALVAGRGPVEEDVKWNAAFTWLKLAWGYEQHRKVFPGQPEKLHILGGAATRTTSGELLRAVKVVAASERETARDSLAANRLWFMEAAVVGRQLRAKRRAEKVSVLAGSGASGAKLIHFDGEPVFSDEEWQRIARVVLFAPRGLTWVQREKKEWKSNREGFAVMEGEWGWYAANPLYGTAPEDERAAYRDALKLVRSYARDYGERLKKPLPTPLATTDEMRSLKRAMLRLFHPDMRVIDIGTGFKDVLSAFEVLERFHK